LTISNRLRFKALTKKDLYWCLIGFVLVGISSLLLLEGLVYFVGEFDHSPPFMSFDPLTSDRYWLLLVWFPYWILNIFGEEFLWRGVMLPRQELAFGKLTWFVHGSGWLLFHMAFGWQLLITLMPLIYIQSYCVQRTKNSWVGVILHGGINGPSFILICFGVI
jgi:membrane protease YdiL (CAAX protease family)